MSTLNVYTDPLSAGLLRDASSRSAERSALIASQAMKQQTRRNELEQQSRQFDQSMAFRRDEQEARMMANKMKQRTRRKELEQQNEQFGESMAFRRDELKERMTAKRMEDELTRDLKSMATKSADRQFERLMGFREETMNLIAEERRAAFKARQEDQAYYREVIESIRAAFLKSLGVKSMHDAGSGGEATAPGQENLPWKQRESQPQGQENLPWKQETTPPTRAQVDTVTSFENDMKKELANDGRRVASLDAKDLAVKKTIELSGTESLDEALVEAMDRADAKANAAELFGEDPERVAATGHFVKNTDTIPYIVLEKMAARKGKKEEERMSRSIKVVDAWRAIQTGKSTPEEVKERLGTLPSEAEVEASLRHVTTYLAGFHDHVEKLHDTVEDMHDSFPAFTRMAKRESPSAGQRARNFLELASPKKGKARAFDLMSEGIWSARSFLESFGLMGESLWGQGLEGAVATISTPKGSMNRLAHLIESELSEMTALAEVKGISGEGSRKLFLSMVPHSTLEQRAKDRNLAEGRAENDARGYWQVINELPKKTVGGGNPLVNRAAPTEAEAIRNTAAWPPYDEDYVWQDNTAARLPWQDEPSPIDQQWARMMDEYGIEPETEEPGIPDANEAPVDQQWARMMDEYGIEPETEEPGIPDANEAPDVLP